MRFPVFLLLLVISLTVTQSFSQNNGNWQLTGPDDFPVNVSGQINGIGRVCQIKFHPNQDSILYAASASGGLFISRDNGLTWQVTGTDQLPKTACASVCISHVNDSILYLSTGDPNYYGDDYGIYKSINGGATWNPANVGIGNRMAVEMLMHPSNHNIIIAATTDGIWKTTNGGNTWLVKKSGGDFTDMTYKPVAGTSTIYAATKSQFWKSTDMGETWIQVSIPIPPGGSPNGLRIGVSPADTNRVYIGLLYFTPTTHYGTVYRSDNGAQTFYGVKTQQLPDIAGYNANDPGQGNYNWTMTVNPSNADMVYTGSHCVWRSDDGGYNWNKLTDWYVEVHTDMHHFIFNPYNPAEFWQANDGGVWMSTDDGLNWVTRSDGLAATENYHAAQSPITREMVSIGTQDNGELYYNSNGWFTNRGGDWGSRMIFDYLFPTMTYYYENGKRRSLTGSEQSLSLPFTPTNNSEFAFTPHDSSVGYVAYDQLWVTVNLDYSPPAWNQLGTIGLQAKGLTVAHHRPDQVYVVTSNAKVYRCDNALSANPAFTILNAPASTNVRAAITTVASDTNVVYIACNSKVYRSPDRGATWTDYTDNLPNVNVIAILHDPSAGNESIYVGTAKSVWYRNDTMSYWLNYSNGLPTIADMKDLMMYNNGTSSNVLRVAYYGRGVWQSELFDAASALPDPLFSADTVYGCPGLQVHFTDLSTGNPTGWQWDFPGGTPSSSNLQNPVVDYPSGGIYDVTLSVTNTNGSNSFTRSSYIAIMGATPLPVQEGFQGNSFLPAGWVQYSTTQGGAWEQANNAGGFGLSTRSARFDNFNQDFTGNRFAIRTLAYDLSNADSALLTFDVAYAQYSTQYSDTLIVSASTDCGQTWTELYYKGGYDLSTAPNQTATAFVPASFQWRTDSIWLDGFSGSDQVQLSFENLAGYGQMLYLDNINLVESIYTSLTAPEPGPAISVYRNPTNGAFTVSFQLAVSDKLSVYIYDTAGRRIMEKSARKYDAGFHSVMLETDKLATGLYRVEVRGGEFSRSVSLEVNR
jgi:PKD repeat protein